MVDFICNVYDNESGVDRVELYFNDELLSTKIDSGPEIIFGPYPKKEILKTDVFKFAAYNGVGLSAYVILNGSEIKSHPKSQYHNLPPDEPLIAGETEGKVGKEYEYTFRAIDPDGDDVSYYIEWEDGSSIGWTMYFESGVDVKFKHIWNEVDDFLIRCKAKDVYGAESEWSTMSIPISKSYDVSLLNWLYRFPLIKIFLEFFGNIQI